MTIPARYDLPSESKDSQAYWDMINKKKDPKAKPRANHISEHFHENDAMWRRNRPEQERL